MFPAADLMDFIIQVFVGVRDAELERDRVKYHSLQQQSTLFELFELFPVEIESLFRLDVVARLYYRGEFLGGFLCLRSEQYRRQRYLEGIVVFEAVFGVEVMKKKHGSGNDDVGQLQLAAHDLYEVARLAPFRALFLGADVVFPGGKSGLVEQVGDDGALVGLLHRGGGLLRASPPRVWFGRGRRRRRPRRGRTRTYHV